MRTRARKDDNHTDIVATFRACHASVLDTARLGSGAPDLVIAYNGKMACVEVKDGKKSPSKRKTMLNQLEFASTWRGKYVIIESVDDVIALLRELS
jgi:Holliday junction resolvase